MSAIAYEEKEDRNTNIPIVHMIQIIYLNLAMIRILCRNYKIQNL